MAWDRGEDPALVDYVANLVALRRRHDVFRRLDFFTGAVHAHTGLKDIYWLAPDGREMTGEDWSRADRRVFGIQFGKPRRRRGTHPAPLQRRKRRGRLRPGR